jgi:hypothetical protein
MQILPSAEAGARGWQGCGMKCTKNKRLLMPTMLLKNGNRIYHQEIIIVVKNKFIVVSGTAAFRTEKHFKPHPCFFVELRVL